MRVQLWKGLLLGIPVALLGCSGSRSEAKLAQVSLAPGMLTKNARQLSETVNRLPSSFDTGWPVDISGPVNFLYPGPDFTLSIKSVYRIDPSVQSGVVDAIEVQTDMLYGDINAVRNRLQELENYLGSLRGLCQVDPSASRELKPANIATFGIDPMYFTMLGDSYVHFGSWMSDSNYVSLETLVLPGDRAMDPMSQEFKNVTRMLADPSKANYRISVWIQRRSSVEKRLFARSSNAVPAEVSTHDLSKGEIVLARKVKGSEEPSTDHLACLPRL